MADSGKTAADIDERPAAEYFREPLGRSWLIGLLVIPLLIAGIGYIVAQRSQSANVPALAPTSSTSSTSFAPRLSLAPLSIVRNGNSITVNGDFPDEPAKAALMKAITGSLPPGANVIDQIRINPDAKALDFTNAGPVFTASAPIPDFNLTVNVDAVILMGTAASPDQKVAIERAASDAWHGVSVLDRIEVKGPVPPPGSPSAAPPGPAGPAACPDLQPAINTATGGPIYFGNDGVSLTPASEQALTQVADKLKACPGARVIINGYTDNSGSESVNVPLSTQRAATVADFLVAHGVARDHVVARGLSSTNPIAPNDTAEGRAKNRRAEIVVR